MCNYLTTIRLVHKSALACLRLIRPPRRQRHRVTPCPRLFATHGIPAVVLLPLLNVASVMGAPSVLAIIVQMPVHHHSLFALALRNQRSQSAGNATKPRFALFVVFIFVVVAWLPFLLMPTLCTIIRCFRGGCFVV